MATLTSQAVLYFNTSRWLYGQKIVNRTGRGWTVASPRERSLTTAQVGVQSKHCLPTSSQSLPRAQPTIAWWYWQLRGYIFTTQDGALEGMQACTFTGQRCSFTAGMHIMHLAEVSRHQTTLMITRRNK